MFAGQVSWYPRNAPDAAQTRSGLLSAIVRCRSATNWLILLADPTGDEPIENLEGPLIKVVPRLLQKFLHSGAIFSHRLVVLAGFFAASGRMQDRAEGTMRFHL